jgi:hypothetical protein
MGVMKETHCVVQEVSEGHKSFLGLGYNSCSSFLVEIDLALS